MMSKNLMSKLEDEALSARAKAAIAISKRRDVTQPTTLDAAAAIAPATLLLERRRQMLEVQEALEAQKSETKQRELVFQRREANLRKKDIELQDSLIKFNKFLQENDSKRARAEKKAIEEKRIRLAKEAEIRDLERQLRELHTQRDEARSLLTDNQLYQGYLEQIVQSSPYFKEVGDLLLRHETLRAANSDLQDRATSSTQVLETLRQEYADYTAEQAKEILELTNRLAARKLVHENLQGQETLQLQVKGPETQSIATKRYEQGRIKLACENLYTRCQQHRKKRMPSKTLPLPAQLRAVQETVEDVRTIVHALTGTPAPAPSE